MTTNTIHIFFLIRALDHGGAERQLIELAKGLDKSRFAVTLATFYDGGALRPDIEGAEGVRVISLGKRGRWDLIPLAWRLLRTTRAARPDVIHGYMGVANELGLIAAKLGRARAVWGLRVSALDFSRYDWAAAWSFRVGAWLSRFADLIIANSYAGQQHHLDYGYARDQMVVIPNGIDTERFRPDAEAGQQLRRDWDVGDGEILIGLVGRLDPMKDHPTFLRAAALLAQDAPNVRFVCVGSGPAAYQRELQALAAELDLADRVIWAGPSSDMRAVYGALQIATSASAYGEGFANVVGEAMACGVPCAVTDVGDSVRIVADTGQVVPPGTPQALADAWRELIALGATGRAVLGQRARARVVAAFSIAALVSQHQILYERLLERSPGALRSSVVKR
ncbi:MAG: glycosyltransferase [Kouleothrix sp.]|nr:glycosyltransferase [Kouleothrix sp.]